MREPGHSRSESPDATWLPIVLRAALRLPHQQNIVLGKERCLRRATSDPPDQWLPRSHQRLFQAAKRKARGYGRFQIMRVVIFLVAGNLDFSNITPHAA